MGSDANALAERLIECEQRLSSTPEIEHRLELALDENARLRRDLETSWRQMEVLTRSTSWRLTAPLRRLAGLGRKRPEPDHR
jgi:hypothetical protein